MEELLKFLEKNPVFYLATDDEGQPRVEFCTMAPDTKFVRVNGEVVFDNDNMQAKENVFKVMPDLLKMYGSAENPAMSVFYLKDMHATIASLTEPETVLF